MSSRFLTGVVTGVVIGLLIAPEKGSELRENLTDSANRWRDQFNRLLGRAGARVDDLRTMLANEVDGLTDDMRTRINAILDEESLRETAAGFTAHVKESAQPEFRPL